MPGGNIRRRTRLALDEIDVQTLNSPPSIGRGVRAGPGRGVPRAVPGIRFDPDQRPCYGCLVMKAVTEQDPISLEEIRHMAAARFGDLVKAVVDVERGIMVVDAELHADEEAELLVGGSRQQDLWGINLYPDLAESEWLEFDSMINLRPSFGNRSRGVDDSATRDRIATLVTELVRR